MKVQLTALFNMPKCAKHFANCFLRSEGVNDEHSGLIFFWFNLYMAP